MFIFITNKNIDIEISARDAFMEKKPSPGTIILKRLENPSQGTIILKRLENPSPDTFILKRLENQII
jgi:hypothetical protein